MGRNGRLLTLLQGNISVARVKRDTTRPYQSRRVQLSPISKETCPDTRTMTPQRGRRQFQAYSDAHIQFNDYMHSSARRAARIRALANAEVTSRNPTHTRGPASANEYPEPQLTIRIPPLRTCQLCDKGLRVFAHNQAQNTNAERCTQCQYLEKCTTTTVQIQSMKILSYSYMYNATGELVFLRVAKRAVAADQILDLRSPHGIWASTFHAPVVSQRTGVRWVVVLIKASDLAEVT